MIKYFIEAILLFLIISTSISWAGIPFNTAINMDIGIGTSTPQGAFVVTNGNVGIGTWATSGGNLIVNGGGNVGIGTPWPGKILDVNGTLRATTFSGNGALVTGVTPSPAGNQNAVQYNNAAALVGNETKFSFNGKNVGIGTTNGKALLDVEGNMYVLNNLGIGTTTPQAGLVVTDGNVGIGTWTASNGALIVIGNVGIGTSSAQGALVVTNGNVGIGTFAPTTPLEVFGTMQITNGNLRIPNNGIGLGTYGFGEVCLVNSASMIFNVSRVSLSFSSELMSISKGVAVGVDYAPGGYSPTNGLIVEGNVGIGTVTPGSQLSVVGGVGIGTGINSSYVTTSAPSGGLMVSGNTGIGTTTPQTQLSILGNVGIGTWRADNGALIVQGGNVGIGTIIPNSILNVVGNVGIGTSASFNYLMVSNLITFSSEFDNGSQGSNYTLNWSMGNNQKITLTGSFTISFTAPTIGVSNLQLKVAQGGGGSFILTWPGSVTWLSGLSPTLTTTAGAVDVINCFYDGSNYFCSGTLNFH